MKEFSIHFGALCDTPSAQLVAQGVALNDEQYKYIDGMAASLTSLYLNGILSDTECLNGRRRLLKSIQGMIPKEYRK